ncbi:hypothetical protein VC83_03279 [Pseudogymnoascus destructans]|uniref:Domain of unknown function at the cortex 1 domain-containing protein n=2 Tax=Pseudogymnoascus destructans TaxID=655981 RepID=L8GAF6_PSED2|nr:uncharacterized protein VC83_03279 [Pseudogymnoascus destructans]ELR09884.1 hypothetical protein GMDG_04362 [Pseudogymnoascus destructans 20631-21]OAF60615.2 hypothetical protein VC83_03279 [Pseudogymnoascus destructans]
MAHNKYTLRVTAGTSYDPSTHETVTVNSATPISIKSEHTDVSLNIRIRNYHGLPHSSPENSPYFSLPDYTKHQYSISFSFNPTEAIPGDDLVFGNDFDHPIRDRLPPAFGSAFKIVKWAVDPGLEADVYADKPWLFGKFLSSIDKLWLGSKNGDSSGSPGAKKGKENFDEKIGILVQEGGAADGLAYRKEKGIPDTAAARKKYFLVEGNRKGFEFEAGRPVFVDFGNPYLDFNKFALKLPGFHLPIMSYWDGQPLRKGEKRTIRRSHSLRYVLKNRVTGVVYLVVLFSLYLKEDVNEDGTIKEGVDLNKGKQVTVEEKDVEESESSSDEEQEEEKPAAKNGDKTDDKKEQYGDTNADDVD